MRYTLFILFILTINSCKKEEAESQITFSYINETFKINYSFNEDSYWIYQDQRMNIDSIIVESNETDFTSICPSNQCARNEYIKLTFKSLINGRTFNHYLMSDHIKYNGGGNWGQDGQPIYMLNKTNGYTFNGLVVAEKLDSLPILGNIFYNVEKMSVKTDIQYQKEFEYDTDFYFAPKVGIVRQVIHDTINGITTWDLKNYSIK